MNNQEHKRGFAGMSEEKRKAIASAGGKAAHKSGRAYKLTSEKAREAQAQRKTWRKKNSELKK